MKPECLVLKAEDFIFLEFKEIRNPFIISNTVPTKLKVLREIASIFDPLGLKNPVMVRTEVVIKDYVSKRWTGTSSCQKLFLGSGTTLLSN